MNKIDAIVDYLNAADYYVSGATPSRIPRSQKSFLRVQEYLVRPESPVSVGDIRRMRQSEPVAPSLLGYAFGFGQFIAFTREEINDQGFALFLPKIAGVYNDTRSDITPLPASNDFKEQLTNFFLNSKNYPDQFKRLLVKMGGFQMI